MCPAAHGIFFLSLCLGIRLVRNNPLKSKTMNIILIIKSDWYHRFFTSIDRTHVSPARGFPIFIPMLSVFTPLKSKTDMLFLFYRLIFFILIFMTPFLGSLMCSSAHGVFFFVLPTSDKN